MTRWNSFRVILPLPSASHDLNKSITRALFWWDGLSLIQQRTPTSRDRFVDVVESALLMQHEGFVQAAIANLGKDLDKHNDDGGDGATKDGTAASK